MTLVRYQSVTEEAEKVLSRIGDGLTWMRIRAAIDSNRAALYRLPMGWLVIQKNDNELLVLAYAGRQALSAMEVCKRIALANGCTHVVFYTQRKGLARLLKQYNPVETSRRYTMAVQDAH